MANLRLKRIRPVDNRTIRAQFTENLSNLIDIGNIDVSPLISTLPKPEVLSVNIYSDIIDIIVQPLTPFSEYRITFKSTNLIKFVSINNSYLFEDGKTNAPIIYSLAEPPNAIKKALNKYLNDQVYDLDGTNLISNIIDLQSNTLSKSLYDIGQAANDNYLEYTVVDEVKTRGAGAYDRLNQEGAFEILRVGLTETNYSKTLSFNYPLFPKDIISLKKISVINEILNAGDNVGTFNNLILTVRKNPVIKVNSIIFNYQDGYTYTYDIATYGYRLYNSIYDTQYASTLLTLEQNQIQLNEEIFNNTKILGVGDTVIISYEYKSLGRIIDETTVSVSKIIDIVREMTPAIITEFSLEHFPIVDSTDTIPTLGGITFLNPRACIPFSEIHPAFNKEIPYRLEGLPAHPGEYSVNYENGRVFVYGELTNSGTGIYPPVATYKYRSTFTSNLDYTYNPDTGDLAASPLRELINQNATIKFNYEDVLVPGIDYIANVHAESLNERIENRLVSLTSLRTLHNPITNVFRLINETNGEIYPVNRFNDTTIFFSTNTPPRIENISRERANFTNILNELLIKSSELINSSNVRIYKINLLNNNIISATEDSIGSSFNSSVSFSRNDIFAIEIYYDRYILSELDNINKLRINDYTINYEEGIVYVGVSNSQDLDIGTINYKAPRITTQNKHIISVSGLYHNLDNYNNIVINLNYNSFTDNEITPETFEVSDERFLNGDLTQPFILDSNQITVSDNIKDIRGIYDVFDLNNNIEPINFVSIATFSGNTITLSNSGINQQDSATIETGGIINLEEISPGMQISFINSIIRVSDGKQLWDNSVSFSNFQITLSGLISFTVGDVVIVNYQVSLNGGATPVVDYNRGDYYVDYSYLADEILVSYEYGDNVIDFRQSNTINEGTQYYVSYKVGALRDSLYTNFGTLVDLPIIGSFDTSFNREKYRDALQGALQSFTKGPTLNSIKKLVSSITKIDPEIVESAFEFWSLGIGSIYPKNIDYSNNLLLTTGKFDNGLLIENTGDYVSLPLSSNMRLEEGSLEFWVIPEWDGLDNDASITFSNLKLDGYNINENNIWIGARSYHPEVNNNEFTISRFDENDPKGLPSAIFFESGVFIYYDEDNKRWQFLVKNKTNNIDGYVYTGKIFTSGEFYDVKFIENLGEPDDLLRSISNEVEFRFNINYNDGYSEDGYNLYDGYIPGYSFDGITFLSDDKHYLFDAIDPSSEIKNNRISIYKDGSGFINFDVIDNKNNLCKLSYNISNWRAGEKHLIGASWNINSFDRRDELHLFIDGFEIPNILRFGGNPLATSSDKFRTAKPEILLGTISKKIIKSNNLQTTYNSNVVYSTTINFALEGIVVGDSIEILEPGFGVFLITNISDNILYLNSPAPATLTDARFATNVFTEIVSNDIDLSSNVAVYIRHTNGTEEEMPGLRAIFPSYKIARDALLRTVFTLYGPADVGDRILVKTLGLNYRRCRESVYLWGAQSILKTQFPPPILLDDVNIYAVILPLLNIGPDNATVVGDTFVATGLIPTNVSNSIEGRQLDIRITGGNVDFSTPVQIQINGTSDGPISEILVFTEPTTQTTTNRWKTFTGINIVVKPIVLTSVSIGVEIRENLSITKPGINNIFPLIRYSYRQDSGIGINSLGDGTLTGISFIDTDVGKKIVITSPVIAAGTYSITSRNNDGSIIVSPIPVAFVNGSYVLYNTTIGRSGFANGFFTFELAGSVNTLYPLPAGKYEFDYPAWLEIPFINVENHQLYLGTDYTTMHPSKSIIDELRIVSNKLSDVRVGEVAQVGQKSFTADYVALKPYEPDTDTLTLIHFDNLPLENEALWYKIATRNYLQSSISVNSEFGKSLLILDSPYKVDNNGKLSTRSEGTIEFWVSPKYDVLNDPVVRYYFDASGSITESLNSVSAGTVKLNGRASEIYSVRLASDTNETGINYYTNGSLLNDRQTIKLGLALPGSQTPVIVSYVPSGVSGDRISIYKNEFGFLVFEVLANGELFNIKQPIFWQRDTWHRIFVSFKFNTRNNRDEIRLFVDGREGGIIRFGQGLLFGQGFVFGQERINGISERVIGNMDFTDTINEFYIGSNFRHAALAAAKIDNLKISNIARPPLICSGISVDENYQTNILASLPVVSDLYTLYLSNFDTIRIRNEEFAILRDAAYGIFNFVINVIDSFRILDGDIKIEQVLRELIGALKPANSKAEINIIR